MPEIKVLFEWSYIIYLLITILTPSTKLIDQEQYIIDIAQAPLSTFFYKTETDYITKITTLKFFFIYLGAGTNNTRLVKPKVPVYEEDDEDDDDDSGKIMDYSYLFKFPKRSVIVVEFQEEEHSKQLEEYMSFFTQPDRDFIEHSNKYTDSKYSDFEQNYKEYNLVKTDIKYYSFIKCTRGEQSSNILPVFCSKIKKEDEDDFIDLDFSFDLDLTKGKKGEGSVVLFASGDYISFEGSFGWITGFREVEKYRKLIAPDLSIDGENPEVETPGIKVINEGDVLEAEENKHKPKVNDSMKQETHWWTVVVISVLSLLLAGTVIAWLIRERRIKRNNKVMNKRK